MPKSNIKAEDRVRLRHMPDAAIEIQQYVQSATREGVPEIPWPIIIGMRNRLIHAYFSINLAIVWRTSTEDIPPLMAELQRLVGDAQ